MLSVAEVAKIAVNEVISANTPTTLVSVSIKPVSSEPWPCWRRC